MPHKVKIFTYAAAGAATPLHDGTNSPTNPPIYVKAFFIEPTTSTTVYVGDAGVTGAGNGITVAQYAELRANSPHSRGETDTYDLTKIYYIGGALKLVIDAEAK